MVDSLARIVAPFDVEVLNAALSGELTLFDVDGRFEASHMGDPKQSSPGPQAFYTKAFLAGMQAIAWFAAHRPVGDPLRAKVPELYEKIRARLQNEALLLMGGFRDGDGDGHGYVYFTPLRLARGGPEERVVLENVTYPVWKSEPFPFPGVYGVYKAFTSEAFARMVERVKTTPLTEGQWEADPRASVPDLVREAMARHELSEDAATLYLQLLTLADCSDQDVREINDWKSDRLKKAGAELAKATLVVQERKLRSGRDYALPGAWEKLRAPQPGIERDKLTLYDTRMIDEIPAAPLGRILPLAPLHELFAAAWATHSDQDERKPRPRARPVAKSAGDAKSEEELIAAIVEGHARDPNDDGPRLVYADLLTERGDRRGEFIVLACQIAASANIETAMQYRYNQLLEDPETAGISFAQQHTVKLDWDRGFVVGVHMKIPAFVRHGARLMKEHPLLRRLVLNTGLRKIPDGQMETLAACPLLSRITELDFADHFVHSQPFIQFLKSPHLTKLRRLRIGANPRGGGIGKGGLAEIASCAALSELRVLDLPGQRVGDGGATALATAPVTAGAANFQFSKLEVVRLPMNDISDVGAAALLDAAPLSKLRYLELDDARFIQGAGGIYGQRPNRFSPAMLARIRTDARSDPSAIED